MKSVFNLNDCNEIAGRINILEKTTQALWAKMSVGQILAQCNVNYEMLDKNNHPSTNAFVTLILSVFVKKY